MSILNLLVGNGNTGDGRLQTSYSVIPDKVSVLEGNSVTFTIIARNITNGTVLYWTTTGTTTGPDFTDGLTSNSVTVFTVADPTVTRTLLEDNVFEGTENLTFQLRTGSITGPIVATAPTVLVTEQAYSVKFNGTSQYLNSSINSPTSTIFTIECFVYITNYFPSNTGGYLGLLLSGTNNSTFWFYLSGTASSITAISMNWVGTSGPPVIVAGGLSIPLNTWQHIAISRNDSTWAIWLNGVKRTLTTVTNPASTYASGPMTIGVNLNNPGWAGYFPGYISNLRIVTGTYVYNPSGSDITVPTESLRYVSGTILLTCQSSTFVDNSGNNVTISPVNSPTISKTVTPF